MPSDVFSNFFFQFLKKRSRPLFYILQNQYNFVNTKVHKTIVFGKAKHLKVFETMREYLILS